MTADLGREAVYAAEIAAFEGTTNEQLHDLDRLVALAARATDADWWPHGSIDVVAARRDAGSSSTRQRGSDPPVIRLAAPQLTPATVIHELAHVLAGVDAGHGPRFRRAHVDLAGWVLGPEPATWLVEAYAAIDLDLGHRTWPTPPLPPSPPSPGAIAL